MTESKPHNPANDETQLREELVAYLDGELDGAQSQRIEQRAAVEPDARRMLEELDRTWQMLDELDAQPTSEDFTCTTLEMVALAAAADAEKAKAAAPRRRLRARLWAAGGLIGAAVTGFLIVTSLISDPNAQLLQDLPILESFDQYREIDSIDFLRALSNEKLFPEAADVCLGTVETLSQRRQRVEEMSAESLDDLFRNEQQFRALSPQEQQRIRDLHDQIESASDRDRLRAMMNRYDKWSETQPPFRRAMLRDKKKTLKDRIAMVKELLAKQDPTKVLHQDDRNRREPDEQLANFFGSSMISDEERDRLMSLSGDEMYDNLSKQYRAHMLKQSKSAKPPRGDRPPGQHGHHPGSPRGSSGRRLPENRDEKDPRSGEDFRRGAATTGLCSSVPVDGVYLIELGNIVRIDRVNSISKRI